MANGEKGKGRSKNQKLKLLYLLDYLLENTDENNTVKVDEIIKHFENYHQIPIENKTVCADLHLLDEYGYETRYDGRTRGWRIIEREFWLLQKDHEFFIGVNLFDSFGSLVELDVQIGVAFLVTPREEDLESSCVTVDGACGQPLFPHTQNHVFQVLRVQAVHWNGYIHSLGD